jgi:hypothetical protein
MCADCTVSICEGCADQKSGVGIEDATAGKEVEMAEATSTDEVADASTIVAAAEPTNAGGDVVATTAGEEAISATEHTLDWCGPYHEVFSSAYLEWKAAGGSREGFVSTEGVEFKPSSCKQGGRKRKAT